VLEVELTAEQERVVKEEKQKEQASLRHRAGGFLRSSRGWLRRKKPEELGVDEADAAEPEGPPPTSAVAASEPEPS
jgi:hypothetical protein